MRAPCKSPRSALSYDHMRLGLGLAVNSETLNHEDLYRTKALFLMYKKSGGRQSRSASSESHHRCRLFVSRYTAIFSIRGCPSESKMVAQASLITLASLSAGRRRDPKGGDFLLQKPVLEVRCGISGYISLTRTQSHGHTEMQGSLGRRNL